MRMETAGREDPTQDEEACAQKRANATGTRFWLGGWGSARVRRAICSTAKRVALKATWVSLARVQGSYVSKVLSALSLSALFISNVPDMLHDLGVAPWTITSIYIGSVLFLAGYAFFHLDAPIEFRGGGEIVDHVSRMQILSGKTFVEGRMTSAKNLFDDVTSHPDDRIPRGPAESLKRTLADVEALCADRRRAELPRLYQDDLALREHVRPGRRLRVAFLFGAGAVLLALPTLWNVLRSLFRLLPGLPASG